MSGQPTPKEYERANHKDILAESTAVEGIVSAKALS